jgi:hypothetical protein
MPNTPPTLDGSALPFVRSGTAWTRMLMFAPQPFGGTLSSSWLTRGPTLTAFPLLNGPGNNTDPQWVEIPGDCVHDLAVMTSLVVYISPNNAHTSLPTTYPAVNVVRYSTAANTFASLSSTGASVFPTAGSVGAYNAPNQSWTFTPNQNNIIDKSLYKYLLYFVDENGGGAIPNNLYQGVQVTYTLDSSALAGGGFGSLWFP